MGSDRPVKCPSCEKYFRRSENKFKYFKKRYWHLDCFKEKEKQEQDKEKLLQYIQRLLNKKIDYKINNQLKNYTQDKQYEYHDIYNALYYFFEIRGNSTSKANGGIGIVPYVIDEAREYFEKKEKIAASAQNIEPLKIKKVKITDPTKKDKHKKYQHIDIDII